MKRVAIIFAALLLSGCAATAPTLPQTDGLWSVSIAPENQPDKARLSQLCITHDPAYLAQMQAYADKLLTMVKVEQKITNEKRTKTSWSYDYIRTMSPIHGDGPAMTYSGSRQINFPDDKHRTTRETTVGKLGTLPALNLDQVTTMTWISQDCGDVKPISIENFPLVAEKLDGGK
jgi:hypothetical protein